MWPEKGRQHRVGNSVCYSDTARFKWIVTFMNRELHKPKMGNSTSLKRPTNHKLQPTSALVVIQMSTVKLGRARGY